MKKREILRHIVFLSLAIFLLYGVSSDGLAESSPSFQLDFGGVITGSDNTKSDDFEMQSGFSSIETNSSSPNFQITTINLFPICGNGVIEGGEMCDTNNFSGQTCSDFGFSLGTLTCINCQSISTVNCSNPPPPPPSPPPAGGVVLPIFSNPVDPDEEDSGDEIIDDETDDGLDDDLDDADLIDEDLIYDSADDIPDASLDSSADDIFDFGIGTPIVAEDGDLQTEMPIVSEDESFGFVELENVFPKFTEWRLNRTVDLDPVFIEQMEALKEYTLYLRNLDTNETILNAKIISDSLGKLIFETEDKLELGKYVFELFDEDNNRRYYYEFEIVEEIYSKFEIDSFVNIQNVDTDFAINGVLNLGKILKTDEMFISGKTAKNTRIDSFFQSRIFHVLEFSDEDGAFKIKIPNELSLGKHSLRIVQTYPDKTISDDLQFEFELVDTLEVSQKSLLSCFLYFLLILILALYFFLILKKEKRFKKWRKSLSKYF
jgi:hypothetical protein